MAKATKKVTDAIIDNPESTVRLRCTVEYTVKAPNAEGKMEPRTYTVGEVLERKEIFLNPKKWEIAE